MQLKIITVLMKEITNNLKEKYKNNNYLTRFLNNGLYPLTESYIDLAIANVDDVRVKEDDLSKNSNYRGERLLSYESLHQVSHTTDIAKIFDRDNSNTEFKKILMCGRAGMGKSTMCRYIAAKWQEGELWKDKFEGVILLSLGELVHMNPTSIPQVIIEGCISGDSKPTIKNIEKYIKLNRSRLLFILDGYDEIAQVIKEEEHANLKRLVKEILIERSYHVILTSKPMAIQQIDSDIITFDRRLESIGFTNENIKSYIDKFNSKESNKLVKFLSSNNGIWEIAHTPINLDLICSLWEQSNSKDSGYTITDLYSQILDKLLEKYQVTYKIPEISRKEEKQLILDILGEIALQGILGNQIIISAEKVGEIVEKTEINTNKTDIFNKLLRTGLISTIGSNRDDKDNGIYFSHLTFQEYIASKHIAKSFEDIGSQKNKEAEELLAQHKYTSRYEMIWWFVAGILYKSGKNNNNLGLIHFFNQLESHPRTLTGFQHVDLIIKCLDECKVDEKVPGVKELLLAIVPYIKLWISDKISFKLKKITLTNLSISSYIMRNRIIDEICCEALNHNDENIKRSAMQALLACNTTSKEVANCLATLLINPITSVKILKSEILHKLENEYIIEYLVKTLEDKSIDVRISAARILGEIGNRITAQPLINALNDRSVQVRIQALQALGKIGNEDAVQTLAVILNDKNESLRSSAAHVLSKINSKAATQSLILALRDKNENVRSSAAIALGNIKNDDTTQPLIVALKDESENVRSSAAIALGKIKNKAAIKYLISALKDESTSVRDSAATALGQIGTKVAIQSLVIASNDDNEGIRSSAIYALGEINDDAVIDPLVKAFFDKNDQIRNLAACALGKVGDENTARLLAATLKQKNENIKYSTIKALSNIGNEFAVKMLITALRNKNIHVRLSAASELGKIGNRIAITGLIKSLSDSNKDVRRCAARALGRIGDGCIEVITSLFNMIQSDSNRPGVISATNAFKKIINSINDDNIIRNVVTLTRGNNELIESIRGSLSLFAILKYYSISNDSTWLTNNLLLSNNTLSLDITKKIVYIEDGQSIYEISFTEIQINFLLDLFKRQAQNLKLPINVYEYYQNIGSLGLKSENLGIRELSPLHVAVMDGNLEKVRAILERDKSDINNQYNESEDTPLLLAVKAKHGTIVQYLIEQKADVSCVNKYGEDAAEQGLRSFLKTNRPILNLLFNSFHAHEHRIQSLLECASLQYTGLTNDLALRGAVSSIAGKSNVEDIWCEDMIGGNGHNLLTTYRMYLDNLTSFEIEHNDTVYVNGQNVVSILTMRLYYYTEIYLKLQKGMILDLPSTDEGIALNVKNTLKVLQEEIKIVSNTLVNAKLNLSCYTYYPLDNPEIVRALSYARAEGIIEKLKDSKTGCEYHIPTGYAKQSGGGHCIYVGLIKIGENQIIARVDNRWLNRGYDIYKANGYIRAANAKNAEGVRSYCVGLFELPRSSDTTLIERNYLKEYIGGVIFAICDKFSGDIIEQAYELIYGKNLPLFITQVNDNIKAKINKWSFHDMQSDADNCALSSHNLGVSARCGDSYFKWLKRHELQSVPSLDNRIVKTDDIIADISNYDDIAICNDVNNDELQVLRNEDIYIPISSGQCLKRKRADSIDHSKEIKRQKTNNLSDSENHLTRSQ